jgi:hypothetical protein
VVARRIEKMEKGITLLFFIVPKMAPDYALVD